MNNKLMFVLCYTCGHNFSQEPNCTHNDEERIITGTWVIDEVNKAVSLGYKVTKIFEIWEYEVEQYNPDIKFGGLFTQMMNQFLKSKQEASGWPAHCVDEESKKNIYMIFKKTRV